MESRGKKETFIGGPIIIFLLILYIKKNLRVVAISADVKIHPWICHSAYLCLGAQGIFLSIRLSPGSVLWCMVLRWGIHTLYQSPRSSSVFSDQPKTHSAAPFMPSHESILCHRKYAYIMMPLTWFGRYHYFPEQIEMHLTLSIWLKNSHSHFKPVFSWRFLLIQCLSRVYSYFQIQDDCHKQLTVKLGSPPTLYTAIMEISVGDHLKH